MESCHSVLPPIGKYVPHPPTYRRLPPKIHSTLGHLIEILEQLSSKEELSSVLRSIVAESDDTSPANGCGSSRVDLDPDTIIKVAQILCKLNPNYTTMATPEHDGIKSDASSVRLDDVSKETPGQGHRPSGGAWAQRAIDCKNLSLSKQDSLYLVKKIRDFEQKCKPLQEKNKKFLERNMELTTLNRNLKEQIRNITEENKKLKEYGEQNKRKCNTLSQQLSKEKVENETMATQVKQMEELKAQLIEQCKTISQLKQTSQEKDRRMEVLQQRKKRRLRMSAEHLARLSSPCSTVDDEPSIDSDLSMSSISAGTLSDDDLLEELPHDDVDKTEKKYKLLMKEHLALQKSLAKLQGIIGKTDPERFGKMQTTFETDMYIAQCKIDNLEESLEKYKETDLSWVREKDQLTEEIDNLSNQNKALTDKLKGMTESLREITQAYEESQEQKDDLEFLILETQAANSKTEKGALCDVSTETDRNITEDLQDRDQTKNEIQGTLHVKQLEKQLEMSEEQQKQYQLTIRTLEEKLTQLLQGQGSEVNTVMDQLKQAEMHIEEVQSTMQELQNKVICLQEEKSVLTSKLEKCKEKLDAQEQSLSLTRDEREELLQVKPKSTGLHLNSRLRLAEVGYDSIRERSLERERPLERIKCSSPLSSPRISRTLSETSIDSLSTIANDRPGEDETVLTVSNFDTIKQSGFDKDMNVTGIEKDFNESMLFEDITPRRPRINSVPVLSSTTVHYEFTHEVDRLQKQIADLREENDVLRYEISQKCHGDGSGSDSEDPRSAELRESCEKLRERAQTAEALERQYKDRLKLAEKHISELEVSESVLRDRVEEGNQDCDKLRKQIIRLQRKIRELKEVTTEKDSNEQTLLEKVKYLEETESVLSQKITELESNNHILRQRLDLKDELLGDADFGDNIKERMKTLEAENAGLNAKIIEMEEDNEILRENWGKVADEEANRRDCLEDKIRVLENSNRELKDKLNEQETDLDLSACQSIASEINDDIIENLNEKIRDLEAQIQSLQDDKNQRIEDLEETLDRVKESEVRLTETVLEMEQTEKQLKTHIAILEKSEHSSQTMSTVVGYERKINELKSSQENLLQALDSMEDHEGDLKERLLEMEKSYEKKMDMLEREIAEYQQQEEDLCTRVEELVENENKLLERVEKYKENEMNFKNKIEELENRETSLTVSFSQRMEELERVEKEKSDIYLQRIAELENNETMLNTQIENLTSEKEEMALKLSSLEKHDCEPSEKKTLSYHEQMNSELVKSNTNNNGASIELLHQVESVTRLEKEASASLSLPNQNKTESQHNSDARQSVNPDNQNEYSDLVLQNQRLSDEISKLTERINDFDKEKKSLLDQMKRQEKKRKKSQRNDNVEDYDTIAREVVTYKLEVSQLRGENNDLHERVMELDESEKNLLEQNEKLKSALELAKDLKESSEKERELEQKVFSLESVEAELRKELLNLKQVNNGIPTLEVTRQPSADSAYESGKETFVKGMADKSVGTADFMEGVMGSHEQGKPVSSMFQRIQALEQDNQELEQKLSVLTATDAQVRQLSDKVKALEENEDSLMERVMELEDEEDRLNLEVRKLRKQVSTIPELEDQLNQFELNEKDLNDTKEKLESELDTLKNSMKNSDLATGDIAIRLASVQKMYEDEKKKVEMLLKGEEKWMKSVASEKKAVTSLEEELKNTQEKLEELQTDYENKLSEKDESMKLLKDELNKLVREREVLKKKLHEFENSNNDLEDELTACKISESRMFHRHQQLITQNEELESKLAKLVEIIPPLKKETNDTVDGLHELLKKDNSLMSENPDVVPENPLTSSIFSEQELDVLRSKTPDTELLGSMPLDMLRKIQDFDERETNYQTKIKELESRSNKVMRKVKVLQGREKDLKHEIKELQLELLKYKDSSPSLKLSVSSYDHEKSESDDGLDVDSGDDLDNDIFRSEESSQYNDMDQEQLLLSVKLLEEKLRQENERTERFELVVRSVKILLQSFGELVTSEPLETYIQNTEDFKRVLLSQDHQDERLTQIFYTMIESVAGIKQKLEAVQKTEEKLRASLAEKEIAYQKQASQSEKQIEELESQIQVLSTLSERYPAFTEKREEVLLSQSLQLVEKQISQSDSVSESETQTDRDIWGPYSPIRDQLHLEISQIINIDVPPSVQRNSISNLGQSETIKVNVPPSNPCEDVDSDSDSPNMMDKAEDVLRQRIRELEKLEKHLKQQVQDLEADREELHEIARKDKNIIHDQNVQLRELQLSQRNLQEQIRNFEESENSLYARLDELENELENKDDKIKHLEILEERLKDLVKRYKLDEKILVTKSENLETSMREMTAKEETLKEKVQNLESEKNAFCERSEYLQTRLKELENAELDLAQRAKNQENIVQSLQNTVIELETFGANAQGRVVELEQANFELQQRLHHAMAENSPVTKHASSLQHTCDKLEQELSTLRDSEIKLRQDNDSLEKNERLLQDKVKTLQLKEVELETKVRDFNENESLLKDKVAKLQRSENTLKYRVQELENSGIQAPSDLESSLRENNKLPRTLEDCQRRIIMLQANNAELQDRLQNGSMRLEQGTKVIRPHTDVAGSRLPPRTTSTTVDPTGEPVEEMITKATTGNVQTKPPGQLLTRDHMIDDLMMSLKAPNVITEDERWREIESRMEVQSGGNEKWINIGKAASMYATDKSKERSPNKDEVLELHVALQSETESQLNSQNDTDSGRRRDTVSANTIQQQHQSQLYSHVPPPPPQFGPPVAGQRVADYGFVESLNFNTTGNIDGLNREVKQGHVTVQHGRTPSITDSLADSGRGTASMSLANFGLTLKERIANIERQLSTRESDSARELAGEMDLTSWKARVMESNRKLELAEKDNKYFKEEINKLEKDLEEKSRQYLILEAFLNSVDMVLKQKNLDDKGMITKIDKEVENVRLSLADAVQRPDNIASDPAALNTELSKKDRELAAKRNEVDRLMCELRQWQQECRTIEDMRSNALDSLRGLEMEISELQEAEKQFKQLKDEYNTLKGQLEEEKRRHSPKSTAALRAKILQLTNICNEKDMLIKKLVEELKKLQSGGEPSQLLDDLLRLDNSTYGLHQQLGRSSSNSSLDSGDHPLHLSDTELLHDSSPRHPQRPRSADVYHHKNVGYRHHGNHSRIYANRNNNVVNPYDSSMQNNERNNHRHRPSSLSRSRDGMLPSPRISEGTPFVAVADYDPSVFSQSGHQRMELFLKEGDFVTVLGPADKNGYFEGEVNGMVGLVPASYLQPVPPLRRVGSAHVPGHMNASPERIAQMYNALHGAHQRNMNGPGAYTHVNGYTNGDMGYPGNMGHVSHVRSSGPPQFPENFRVDKIIGNSSLMLVWQQLPLDNDGCNTGVKVTGYRIYKNNKVILHPRGPRATKAIIENIDIHAHHRFGIQTISADGQVSELSEIMYEGVEEVSDENSDTESEMDMSTVLDQDDYKHGPKRQFMAVYDYDPTKNSPQDHPTSELAFNAGDVITVYGRQRADGFYHGEINGNQGLVPAFFIEEVPQPPPRTKKIAAKNKQAVNEHKTEENRQEL